MSTLSNFCLPLTKKSGKIFKSNVQRILMLLFFTATCMYGAKAQVVNSCSVSGPGLSQAIIVTCAVPATGPLLTYQSNPSLPSTYSWFIFVGAPFPNTSGAFIVGSTTSQTVTVNPGSNSGSFFLICTVTAIAPPNDVQSCAVSVAVYKPEIVPVVGARCGTGSVTIGTTGCTLSSGIVTSTVRWYDAPVGGNLVHTGTTFNTPSISATTLFWASCTITFTPQLPSAPFTCENPRTQIAAIVNNPSVCNITSVINTQPKINTSKALLNVGETQSITGKDFTVGGQVSLIIKNSSGDVLPVGAITYLPNGQFSYQFTVTSLMPDGEYSVYAKDLYTGQTTATIKFKVNNPVTRNLWINKPLGTDTYCTGQKFQINWGDFIDKSLPINQSGLVEKKYKIEISNNNGSPWVVLKDGLPLFYAVSGQDNDNFRVDDIAVNAPGTYKIRITDKENSANFKISEEFTVYQNATPGFKATLVWDKSSPLPPNISNPVGLAADGTCRIRIDLNMQLGNPKIVRQIEAAIVPVSNAYTTTALLGKIIHADNPDIYTLEANSANNTSTVWPPTPGSIPNITNTSFWLVAPDDFTDDLDDTRSERKINVQFLIKYTDGTSETVLASCNSILIRRPALMLVYGLNGSLITFKDFKYQIGSNNFQHFDGEGSPWVIRKRIELDPKDYLMENAKIVLSKQKYHHNYDNTFQFLLNEMHKDGFANNRVDYVCHSMGGAVARTIINQFSGLPGTTDDFSPGLNSWRKDKYMNYGKGFINKLITINTPHNGSYVADLVIDRYEKSPEIIHALNFKINGISDYFITTIKPSPIPPFWKIKYLPAPAIEEMQAFDGGKTFKETSIPNHLIASDINEENNMDGAAILNSTAGKIPDYKKLVNYLLDQNESIEDAMAEYSNSDYLKNTDLVVPVSSQLPGKDLNIDVAKIGDPLNLSLNLKAEKTASIIYGIDKQHEGRGHDTVVGKRVFHLLNAPISSGFFADTIASSPTQDGSTVYRNSLLLDTVFTYYDTSFIKINSPSTGSTYYVDSTLQVNLKLKDTTGFREIRMGFQGEMYSSVSPISDQIFNMKINSSFIGKNILVAHSMNDSSGYTVNHVDTLTLHVKALDTLNGFYINPKSQNLNPTQAFQLEYNAIFTNYIGQLNSDIDSLNFAIADTNVVQFDSLLYQFNTKDTGTTHIVFNYKGFSDTAFIYISRPFDENIKYTCPQGITSFFAGLADTTKNYQWQVDTLNGFENIISGAMYSGVDSSTLTLNNAPTNWYNYRYRCIISDSIGETTSPEFTLKFAATWIGASDTAWENIANWSCGALPDSNTDVIIKQVAPRFPQVNTIVSCRSLTLQPGAAILVKEPNKIYITGKE